MCVCVCICGLFGLRLPFPGNVNLAIVLGVPPVLPPPPVPLPGVPARMHGRVCLFAQLGFVLGK